MRTLRITTLALTLMVFCSLSLHAAAQEVVDTVDKASRLVAAKGAPAFQELRGLRFMNGEGYVVISDMDQICLLNPIAPAFEGKDMTALQGAEGKFFVTEMTSMAKTRDSGWISYAWMHPATKEIAQKCLYYQKVTMPGGKVVLVQAGYYGTDCSR